MRNLIQAVVFSGLLAASTAAAQTGTTIPPGPIDDDGIDLKEFRKLDRDSIKFWDTFKTALKDCPDNTLYIGSDSFGKFYTKLVNKALKKGKCDQKEILQRIAEDKTLRCVFKNPEVVKSTNQLIKNPLFTPYVQKLYPKFSDPGQVRSILQTLILKGSFHESKK